MKISCRNVSKIFGGDPRGVLEKIEGPQSKNAIQDQSGQIVAVRNVSFDVQEGETFVVMGLSGSGKSTLIRCISRLIEPTSGQIVVDGLDVTSLDDSQLRELRRHKMSMVFQHFRLFPHRRVVDNVAYGLEIQGISKADRTKKADEILELVGLSGWGNNYPRELSGGMQQRVGLARALAVDPEILLFDEPFSALDPLIRRDMQNELIRLRSLMRKTMVFITHDFLEAIKLGDKLAIMRDGEFVQVGSPEEIVLHPKDDYVQDFTEEVPGQKILSAKSIMRPCKAVVQLDDLVSLDGEQGFIWKTFEVKRDDWLLVEGSDGEYLGALSQSEVRELATEKVSPPFEVLSKQRCIVAPDTKLDEILELVAQRDVPVAVVDGNGLIQGIVDRTAVLRSLMPESTLDQ